MENTEHDCTDYAKVTCKCEPGQCEQRFRHNGKLGDNDIENFNITQLRHILQGINDCLDNDYSMNCREDIYIFRRMLYNAINKLKR